MISWTWAWVLKFKWGTNQLRSHGASCAVGWYQQRHVREHSLSKLRLWKNKQTNSRWYHEPEPESSNPSEELINLYQIPRQHDRKNKKLPTSHNFQNVLSCPNSHNAFIFDPLPIRVRPRFFNQVGHETMYVSSGNKHSFTKSCHHQAYQNY